MYRTDEEILERQKENLHILDLQLAKNKFCIEDVADLMPGIFHMNNLEDVSIRFVNRIGEQHMNMCYQEMIQLGMAHIKERYHPSTINSIMPNVVEFGKRNDYYKVMGFVQQVRKDINENYERFIGFVKVSKAFNSFVFIENHLSVFGNLSNKLAILLDDNEFLRRNYKKFATLTKREIEIIKLIGHGLTRSNISEQLNISKHTFDNHRKHIREKLDINTLAELFQYIRAFDL